MLEMRSYLIGSPSPPLATQRVSSGEVAIQTEVCQRVRLQARIACWSSMNALAFTCGKLPGGRISVACCSGDGAAMVVPCLIQHRQDGCGRPPLGIALARAQRGRSPLRQLRRRLHIEVIIAARKVSVHLGMRPVSCEGRLDPTVRPRPCLR